MLETSPTWVLSNPTKPGTQRWSARLSDGHILIPWRCFCRSTGRLLWQRRFVRANTILDVDSGVIVATDASWEYGRERDLGIYGISLDNGRLMWTSHQSGSVGAVLRLLDFVQGYTNGLRDSPVQVASGAIACRSGRLLDVRTGRLMSGQTTERFVGTAGTSEPELRVTEHFDLCDCSCCNCLHRIFSTLGCPEHPDSAAESLSFPLDEVRDFGTTSREGGFTITAENDEGAAWQNSMNVLACLIQDNYFSCLLRPPVLYVVVSGAREFRSPHANQLHDDHLDVTQWRINVIDLETGQTLQEFPIRTANYRSCRIEDADAAGLLIYTSPGELLYFAIGN